MTLGIVRPINFPPITGSPVLSHSPGRVSMGVGVGDSNIFWDIFTSHGMVVCGSSGSGKTSLLRCIVEHAGYHRDYWDFVVVDPASRGWVEPGAVPATGHVARGLTGAASVMSDVVELVVDRVRAGEGTASRPLLLVVDDVDILMAAVPGETAGEKALRVNTVHALTMVARSGPPVGVYVAVAAGWVGEFGVTRELKTHLAARIAVGHQTAELSQDLVGSSSAADAGLGVGEALMSVNGVEEAFKVFTFPAP